MDRNVLLVGKLTLFELDPRFGVTVYKGTKICKWATWRLPVLRSLGIKFLGMDLVLYKAPLNSYSAAQFEYPSKKDIRKSFWMSFKKPDYGICPLRYLLWLEL